MTDESYDQHDVHPMIDVAFKHAAKDMQVTQALINDLFSEVGLPHIVSCHPLFPEIKATLNGRKSILDLLVRDEKGRDIAVEIQIRPKSFFNNRLLSYWLQVAHQNLQKQPTGSITGTTLLPVIVITVANFRMGEKEHPIHRYDIREFQTGELFSDCLSFVTAQIPRFRKNPEVVVGEHARAWLGWFTNEKRFDSLVEGYEMTQTARKLVDEVKGNESEWEKYLEARRFLDAEDDIEALVAEGEAKGEARGKAETEIKAVKAMLKLGLKVSDVANALGLSVDQVQQIARIQTK